MIAGLEGFGLLIGHLVGDYVFQDDWQAANKANPHPGPEPCPHEVWVTSSMPPAPEDQQWRDSEDERDRRLARQRVWWHENDDYRIGHLACLLHCVLYTFAIWLGAFWWIGWRGLLVVFIMHFIQDRWSWARTLMRWTRHEAFATGKLAPWSVVVFDGALHLVVLYLVALCH